jgi:hypothetical protein
MVLTILVAAGVIHGPHLGAENQAEEEGVVPSRSRPVEGREGKQSVGGIAARREDIGACHP